MKSQRYLQIGKCFPSWTHKVLPNAGRAPPLRRTVPGHRAHRIVRALSFRVALVRLPHHLHRLRVCQVVDGRKLQVVPSCQGPVLPRRGLAVQQVQRLAGHHRPRSLRRRRPSSQARAGTAILCVLIGACLDVGVVAVLKPDTSLAELEARSAEGSEVPTDLPSRLPT